MWLLRKLFRPKPPPPPLEISQAVDEAEERYNERLAAEALLRGVSMSRIRMERAYRDAMADGVSREELEAWRRSSILAGLPVAVVLAGSSVVGPYEDATAAYHRGDYTEAFRLVRPLAEQGIPDAQYSLGVLYEKGWGVPQDYAEAVKWYQLAAAKGLAHAQYNLGVLYDKGVGVPQDCGEAVKWWLAAALGFADAQYYLGVLYYNGWGVQLDYAEAAKWYRLAAMQGFAPAEQNLAILYAVGDGVEQDYAEAAKWSRLAADQGDPFAQSTLGLMYLNGDGVPKNYVLAYMWFSISAARGRPDADTDRASTAALMTPEQIAEAQRLAREWKPTAEGH